MKATCSAFQPELRVSEKIRRAHVLLDENCPITVHCTTCGATGYVDDCSCHLLGAGACEPQRWRPPTRNCPCGADLAWSGPSGGRKGTKTPQGPTANAESPKEATQAEKLFDPEKECNELHEDIESAEDPWAGTGMDADEETLSKELHAGKETGGEKQYGARPRRTTTAA